MVQLHATVVGWVGGKRLAFEVPGEVYDQLRDLQQANKWSDDLLLGLITRGGTRKPTERAALAVLRAHTGER